MQLIVNLQSLLSPLTGIGHYTRELTRLLATEENGQDVHRIYGLSGLHVDALNNEHPLLRAVSVESGQPASGTAGRLLRRYARNAFTRYAYRKALTHRLQLYRMRNAWAEDAIYWEPNFIRLPWQGKSVVTVHDLSHRRFPDYHPKERVAFFNRHLPESLHRATRINVVSEFTARELTALYDVEPGRIDIVPPGVSERFFHIHDTDLHRVAARYRLPSRYCLSVGTLEPRKNLTRLIEAFLALPAARQHDCPLLLVGKHGWGEALSPAAQRAIAEGRIRQLGYVADEDLPALYANAALFAYLSVYEGFGMPIVEAMAAGVPVLTSDRGAMREVAADAAIRVDPEDTDAIGAALERLKSDSALAERLGRAGRARAAQFTWHHSCELLMRSFKKVHNS